MGLERAPGARTALTRRAVLVVFASASLLAACSVSSGRDIFTDQSKTVVVTVAADKTEVDVNVQPRSLVITSVSLEFCGVDDPESAPLLPEQDFAALSTRSGDFGGTGVNDGRPIDAVSVRTTQSLVRISLLGKGEILESFCAAAAHRQEVVRVDRLAWGLYGLSIAIWTVVVAFTGPRRWRWEALRMLEDNELTMNARERYADDPERLERLRIWQPISVAQHWRAHISAFAWLGGCLFLTLRLIHGGLGPIVIVVVLPIEVFIGARIVMAIP
ncbi:MAG: hypothetical protein M3P11_10050 [Actinomycetota bacterium]|nr:hypothetical protein [Actinomycetota bacterium]